MSIKKSYYDFILPILSLGGLMILFHQSFLDEWIAGHFYLSGSWVYRDNFYLEKILHKGGVLFSATLIIFMILSLIWIWNDLNKRKLKAFLTYVLTSSLLTILVVAFLKKVTTLPCPWDSSSFSGGTHSPSIWLMFSLALPKGHCFPGGHASGGYAFLSLYYGYIYAYGRRNFFTLVPGLLIGNIYGFTQQLRGAHFMSHDLATALISICCAWMTLLIYSNYNKKYEN